ncbi:MAG: hypothetical protein HY908_29440, partial [Myxococcales bacterium]|nr:hypothetical protein [Myxococcales bacterium]
APGSARPLGDAAGAPARARSSLRLAVGAVCLAAVATGGTLALWHTRSRDRDTARASLAVAARSDRPSAVELDPAALVVAPTALVDAAAEATSTAGAVEAEEAGARSDAVESTEGSEGDEASAPKLDRAGQSAVPGGVLRLPDAFAPAAGGFDLVIHFHGDADVVAQSMDRAGVDAALAVVNLGVGASPYYRAFQAPDGLDALVAQVERALAARGLDRAHIERLALSAWGAGQGAIASILGLHRRPGALDAILVADGIWAAPNEPGAAALLAPFLDAARAAAGGELLFSLTYSQVDPQGLRIGAELAAAAGARAVSPSALGPVELPGAPSESVELAPLAEARGGGFHARGFVGGTTAHHMALLADMGGTTLAELAGRWRAPARPAAVTPVD